MSSSYVVPATAAIAGQAPVQHAKAATVGARPAAAAPVLPPTGSPSRTTPPSNAAHMKRMPRITLHPTTRVASVPVSPAPAYGDAAASNGNGYRAVSVPRAGPTSPTSVSQARSDDQHAVAAVQAAYEKTEAHLHAIEKKLTQLQEELQRSPSPHHSGRAQTALAPISACGTPASNRSTNAPAAHHHLQPIPSATTASTLTAVPSSPASKPATAAPTPTPTPQKPAGAAAAAVVREPRGSLHPRFSIDDTNVLESPNDSSGTNSASDDDDDSNSSSSSSGGGGGGGGGGNASLPVGVRQSVGKPARPPAPAPPSSTARVATDKVDGAGSPVRQGFGFAGAAAPAPHGPSASTGSGGGGGRRGIKMTGEDAGVSQRSASPLAGSLSSTATSQSTRRVGGGGGGGAVVGTETGEMMSVGRQFRRVSSEVGTAAESAAYLSVGGAGTNAPDNAKAVDGHTSVTRRQASAVKHAREHFFAPIARFADVLPRAETGQFSKHDVEKLLLPGAPCSWLCCASLAISYVSGVPTPVEKVLRANRMGAHSISLPAITLAELFDVVNDYIHTRFHRHTAYNGHCASDEFDEDEEAAQFLSEAELTQLSNIHCEMATFDAAVLDPESSEDIHGMGEHPPIVNLAQFRKELVQHLSEEKSIYIFNYDPYMMEQEQLRVRSNMCDTEEESAAVMAGARYTIHTGGVFGILLSFDPVKHEARLLTPHLTADQHPLRFFDDAKDADADEDEEDLGHTRRDLHRFAGAFANLVLEEQVVSLQALYEAVQQVDNYSRLSRGFVRVFTSETFAHKVPSMFPLFVLDGSSAGGLMTSVLDVKVAPHVLGLAMLHHLSVTFLLTDSARRKQSSRNLLSKANVCDVKLRGIPLTKVCQQLRLPLSMIVCASNKNSISTAFVWYHLFLQQLQIHQDVRIGLVSPARRDGAEDGQPNITDSEFLEHLQLVMKSQSVMLISFDVNVALNVRIDARDEPAHFAIVIGVDEARGIVRLADVNVKRFRKTWHIPISRLYDAVMGYGYMVASKDKKVIKALGGKQYQEAALSCARNFLPPPAPAAYQRFEYPSRPYPLTVLADAVERLGFAGTNVERFLNFCGFHISYFLSRDLPLEGAAQVVQNFSHYALDDAVSVSTTHYDYYEDNPPPASASSASASDYPVRTEADLLAAIQHAIADPARRKLIVKYDVGVLQMNLAVWNGNDGSSFAFVMDYEAPTKMVVLSDASPSSFYRSFACPLTALYTAVCSWDSVDLRARGTILLTTEVSQEWMYEDTKGYDMAHALVHHPFKPTFSAACSCLALAATEMMMNIETPTLLGGAPISFEDDEKKKYKRYNNIFSAEDFLYATPSFSIHDWRTASVEGLDVVSMGNNAFTKLRLPLRAVSVLEDGEEEEGRVSDATALLRACSGVSGLLTITLVAYDTAVLHGVPGASVGLVNRVFVVADVEDEEDGETKTRPIVPGAPANSVGSVQLLEGDPCRWGACFERSAEELLRAVKGVYRVEEVEEEDDEE
ncbi:hypothetical protein NESM_000638800 [Novymonas esmeraldas]|uniref:Uncharacterized protein n=1 Tax=Novymonas esmeraldas TaxID=1808958 RepID=A0AAW0ETC6_9TRYP